MLNIIKFLVAGTLFGLILTKSEVISWYRIQEMFRFQSFHMYGIIGSAVILGAIVVQVIKKLGMKSMDGEAISLAPKDMSITRYLVGGALFGMGWAMTGSCPGPLYAHVGYGYTVMLVAIVSAVAGTMLYGALREKLPH
ncbi:MAG: YeeE/YedE family protein [Cryomorphaceae bacterium]|nr:MAG: YeeE/YedE family protein [Cryomorphaceae bacterium]